MHREEGRLLTERGHMILQREDGGRWRLESDADLTPLLGARVRMTGMRAGFDLLVVTQIEWTGDANGIP
ncbi:MAG TPA: DUF5818 domain-containing protein [Allosphingosinicella sp.]|nr:DUF5818 domain-containing protein [Allosphingosinicella sp.]